MWNLKTKTKQIKTNKKAKLINTENRMVVGGNRGRVEVKAIKRYKLPLIK